MADLEPFKYQASTNIKEHNEIVDKVNEIVGVINDINLDGLGPRLTADEANIKKNTDDITHLKISDTEHTAEISTLESNVDNHAREITALESSVNTHAREITAIKAKNTTQDSEIEGLTESVVSDVTATFDNNTRNLKISIEREKATSIDTTVNIPASAQTGSYSPIVPITISDTNQIGLAIDSSSMEITPEGLLKSKGSGSAYTAGTGIEIVDGVIKLTSQYDAWLKSAYNNGSYVDSTDRKFIFRTKGGIYDKVSLLELVFKSDISDMETKSNASATYATKTELNTKADASTVNDINTSLNPCFKDVSISGNTLTFVTVDNQNKPVELPGGGSGQYVPATYPVEQGGKILGINGNGAVEPKDSTFVEPLFKANFSDATSPSTFMSVLKAGVKIGSMITFFALGETNTSWSGTITGIVSDKTDSYVKMNYIGGTLQENGTILTIGASNYNTTPTISFSTGGVHVNIVKGNAINGRSLSWNEVQGYNVIIYR